MKFAVTRRACAKPRCHAREIVEALARIFDGLRPQLATAPGGMADAVARLPSEGLPTHLRAVPAR
jgi:hypothetical protein